MKHDWYIASAGDLLGQLWLAQPMKVALLKPTYVPNRDTHKLWADIAAHEVVGTGYAAGGLDLTGKTTAYDATADRTDYRAADSLWGPGAGFSAAFAVVYDNTGGKPLWSLIDFEGTKDVVDGTFTIDWSAVGILYAAPA